MSTRVREKHKCKPARKGQYAWPCRVCAPLYYEARPHVKWYIQHLVAGLELKLIGPFDTEYSMEKAVRRLYRKCNQRDQFFWAATRINVNGAATLMAGQWSNAFFHKQ